MVVKWRNLEEVIVKRTWISGVDVTKRGTLGGRVKVDKGQRGGPFDHGAEVGMGEEPVA